MNKERLLLLADHLEQLPDELWDFNHEVLRLTDCGAVGCALGHLPDLWPESWSYQWLCESYDVIGPYRGIGIRANASKFFDVSESFIDVVFYNGSYVYGQDFDKVTKTQVANEIRRRVNENR